MKKMLFAAAMLCLHAFTSFAQQGDVHVFNYTNCVVAVNIVAVCPGNCKEYSSLTMWTVNPNSSLDFPASTYPWNGGEQSPPPCSNWEWYYAEIFVCGNYYRVGRVVSPCTPSPAAGVTVPGADCECGNADIHLSFGVDPVTGEVYVVIS